MQIQIHKYANTNMEIYMCSCTPAMMHKCTLELEWVQKGSRSIHSIRIPYMVMLLGTWKCSQYLPFKTFGIGINRWGGIWSEHPLYKVHLKEELSYYIVQTNMLLMHARNEMCSVGRNVECSMHDMHSCTCYTYICYAG